jgi:Na+-driven multidrug efflux pump
MMMGVWAVWAFDIFTLIASYLSIDEVSAQTVMRSLGLTTFMIPFGLSMSTSILIGKSIGKGSKEDVVRYFSNCMLVAVATGVLQVLILVLL